MTTTPTQPNEAEHPRCNCHLFWSHMKVPEQRLNWQRASHSGFSVCDYADEFEFCVCVNRRLYLCAACDVKTASRVKIELWCRSLCTWMHCGTHSFVLILSVWHQINRNTHNTRSVFGKKRNVFQLITLSGYLCDTHKHQRGNVKRVWHATGNVNIYLSGQFEAPFSSG